MKTDIFDYPIEQLPQNAFDQHDILNRSNRVFEHFYKRQVSGVWSH